jgi:hypothetical protein
MCPSGMEIQTVLFDKDNYSESEAKTWLLNHDLRSKKVDETENNFRFRQKSPLRFNEDSFRTIRLKKGIQAVVACPIELKKSIKTQEEVKEIIEVVEDKIKEQKIKSPFELLFHINK